MSFLNTEAKILSQEFWQAAGQNDVFPCDIELATLNSLPVSIQSLENLTTRSVYDWITQRRISMPKDIDQNSRRILGCLVAHKGMGFIFVDQNATAAEQRFTIAHEVSHFLRDYQLPRKSAAEKLGESIFDVLDGNRSPSIEERAEALLLQVSVGVYSDLMLRGPKNQFLSFQTDEIERKADELALELVAPHEKVLKIASIRLGVTKRDLLFDKLSGVVLNYFGLPPQISADYAKRLSNFAGKKPSVRDWLQP